MSLFDNRFQRAAEMLADSDDEVLQSAGLMAIMRLETLNRRMRGQPTRKALTPPQLTTSNVFPTPWWHKPQTTGFTFGYNQHSQNLFGAPSASAFGATSAGFSSSQPFNASAFGAAPAQSQNAAFGSSQPPGPLAFGAAPTQSQSASGFGSSQSASSSLFGAPQPQSQSTGFGSAQPAGNSFAAPLPPAQNAAGFGAPQPDKTASFGAPQVQPQNSTFGSFPGVKYPASSSLLSSGESQNTAFGSATQTTNKTATFGAPQPPLQSPSSFSFGIPPSYTPEAQAKGETPQTAAATSDVLLQPNTSESAQEKAAEGAEEKSAEAENTLDQKKELKSLTKPVVTKRLEKSPDLDLGALKNEEISSKPVAVKSSDQLRIEQSLKYTKSPFDVSSATNLTKEKDCDRAKSLVGTWRNQEKVLSQEKNNELEKSLASVKPLVSFERKVDVKQENDYDCAKSCTRAVGTTVTRQENTLTQAYQKQTEKDKLPVSVKPLVSFETKLGDVKKENDYGRPKSCTNTVGTLVRQEKSLTLAYQKQADKNDEYERNLVSLERKIEQLRLAQYDALRAFPGFAQTPNFTKLDAPSYTFNRTQVYQPQTYNISNTLVNINSFGGRSAGGCGCRQIQCGDRRCGCKKSGAMCGPGCACSSRGSWCLNR